MTTSEVFDITSSRAQRAAARSAKREGRGDTLELRFDGQRLATLDAEFPLDVLSPLQGINVDLALIVRVFLEVQGAKSDDERGAAVATLIDVLAVNPELPKEVIGAVQEMAGRLLGADGYTTLVAARPTPWDIGALIMALMDWYGVGLGESSPSSTPPTGGETSKPTFNGSTGSTPATSGGPPETPPSLASVAPPP